MRAILSAQAQSLRSIAHVLDSMPGAEVVSVRPAQSIHDWAVVQLDCNAAWLPYVVGAVQVDRHAGHLHLRWRGPLQVAFILVLAEARCHELRGLELQDAEGRPLTVGESPALVAA